MFVLAVEARECERIIGRPSGGVWLEGTVGEMCARGRAGLVAAVGAVTKVVVDARGGKSDGGVSDTGKLLLGGVVGGDCEFLLLARWDIYSKVLSFVVCSCARLTFGAYALGALVGC